MKKIMYAVIILALAVVVLIQISCYNSSYSDTYDVLIKDGLVYDGSTSEPKPENEESKNRNEKRTILQKAARYQLFSILRDEASFWEFTRRD